MELYLSLASALGALALCCAQIVWRYLFDFSGDKNLACRERAYCYFR